MSDKKNIPQPKTKGVVKVPVVMQLEVLECGAASLTMIMHYYRKFIPLEQARVDCGVSRDGANAKNIILAARSYGMEAKAWRVDPEDLIAEGPFRGAFPVHYTLGLQSLCGAVRIPSREGGAQRPSARACRGFDGGVRPGVHGRYAHSGAGAGF